MQTLLNGQPEIQVNGQRLTMTVVQDTSPDLARLRLRSDGDAEWQTDFTGPQQDPTSSGPSRPRRYRVLVWASADLIVVAGFSCVAVLRLSSGDLLGVHQLRFASVGDYLDLVQVSEDAVLAASTWRVVLIAADSTATWLEPLGPCAGVVSYEDSDLVLLEYDTEDPKLRKTQRRYSLGDMGL